MRLLVSVRDADEARAAIAGGADIVDAKEPMLGPLAPVAPGVLHAICAAVPPVIPLSVALGDARPEQLEGVVTAVAPLRRRGALYFKVALLASSPSDVAPAIGRAVHLLRQRPDRPAFIVARYVDTPSDTVHLTEWLDVCAASGAQGLLLDTSRKDGASLLATVDAESLTALRRAAARHGIWLALAGGMTIGDVPLLSGIRPHVVGARGAACDGGRTGTLSTTKVAHLRQALNGISAPLEPLASSA